VVQLALLDRVVSVAQLGLMVRVVMLDLTVQLDLPEVRA
jgi:hypothetical protein